MNMNTTNVSNKYNDIFCDTNEILIHAQEEIS